MNSTLKLEPESGKIPSWKCQSGKSPAPRELAPAELCLQERLGCQGALTRREMGWVSQHRLRVQAQVPETRMASQAPRKTEMQPSQAGLLPSHTQESKQCLLIGPTKEHKRGTLTVWGMLPHPKFSEGKWGTRGVKMCPEGTWRSRVPRGMFKIAQRGLSAQLPFSETAQEKFLSGTVLLIRWAVNFWMQNCCVSSCWLLGSSLQFTPQNSLTPMLRTTHPSDFILFSCLHFSITQNSSLINTVQHHTPL